MFRHGNPMPAWKQILSKTQLFWMFGFVTLVNVVDPDAMRIWRTRLWKRAMDSSSTRRKHCAVRSFVTSFWRFQTPSLCVNSSWVVRHLGRMRHSNPHMLNSRLGLSLLYTDTKLFSHWTVVTDRGNRFLMSQNTARPLYIKRKM